MHASEYLQSIDKYIITTELIIVQKSIFSQSWALIEISIKYAVWWAILAKIKDRCK